jgi:hypothetical protein
MVHVFGASSAQLTLRMLAEEFPVSMREVSFIVNESCSRALYMHGNGFSDGGRSPTPYCLMKDTRLRPTQY